MTNMVDNLLRAEAVMEWQLAGLALCQPKVIAQTNIRPEIDLEVKEFFRRFDRRKADILAADDLTACKIAYSLCDNLRFRRFYNSLEDINTYQAAADFGQELIALRGLRKGVRWLEESRLVEKLVHYD